MNLSIKHAKHTKNIVKTGYKCVYPLNRLAGDLKIGRKTGNVLFFLVLVCNFYENSMEPNEN